MSDTANIAIVTGGSSGLGLACAENLAKRNIPVCLVARHGNRLSEASAAVAAHGSPVLSVEGDVSAPDDVSRLARIIDSEGYRVRWLFNIAGAGVFGPIAGYSPADVEEIMRGNLYGVIYLSQRFLQQLIDTNGVLCNIMSTAANIGRANESVYTAAKWGAKGFTESLRLEMKGQPVKIMSVYPGGMNSPFWDGSRDHTPDPTRFMQPGDVAEIIVRNAIEQNGCQISELTINRL